MSGLIESHWRMIEFLMSTPRYFASGDLLGWWRKAEEDSCRVELQTPKTSAGRFTL
jgi:hypothetical protein